MDIQEQKAAHSRTRVALCRASERASNLRQAIEMVIDQLDWPAYQRVLIKPNLAATVNPCAITHPEALKTVLQAVRQRYGGDLVVAEGSAEESTLSAAIALGYDKVIAHYGARLLDLNADQVDTAKIYNAQGRSLAVRLARSVVQSDCRISLAVPKTHDTVLVTLGIKNMIMGSLVNRRQVGGDGRLALRERLVQIMRGHGKSWRSDKQAMHQGISMINLNLATLADLVWPRLSILDGFVAMEGNGPKRGTAVPWGIAMAGIDPLAVDSLAAELMGFPPHEVGYLHYCAKRGLGCIERSEMEIMGNVKPDKVKRIFVPHVSHAAQRRWPDARAEALLSRRH
jgi:uncharacterized protein (DUF362 family)